MLQVPRDRRASRRARLGGSPHRLLAAAGRSKPHWQTGCNGSGQQGSAPGKRVGTACNVRTRMRRAATRVTASRGARQTCTPATAQVTRCSRAVLPRGRSGGLEVQQGRERRWLGHRVFESRLGLSIKLLLQAMCYPLEKPC